MNKKEYFISSEKYLNLDIKVNYKKILEEAISLKDKFISHKSKSYLHDGWKSLSLHSISQNHIETWGDYGFKNAAEIGNLSVWTDVSQQCPHTMNFLLNDFPCNKYGQIRFEVIEPNGFINDHNSRAPALETIFVPLNNPDQFSWIWDNGEEFKFVPGSIVTLNTHYFHKLINNSKEDRYHLIINRQDSTDTWKSLIDNACSKQDVSGEYITHEIVVF